MDAQDQPVIGRTVVFVPEPPLHESFDLYKVVSSDFYGRFNASVVPGSYKVFAVEDAPISGAADPEFLDRYLRQGVLIRVGEGDESSVRLKVLR